MSAVKKRANTIAKPLGFIQLTDTHLFGASGKLLCGVDTSQSLKELVSAIKRFKLKPDFFIATGDLSQDGTEASYKKLKRLISPLRKPVYCLPGNHDHPGQMKKTLKTGRIRFETDVTVGEWRIVLLDSAKAPHPGGYIRPFELARLKKALMEGKNKNILIALHHNTIPVGSQWMDQMMVKNHGTFANVIGSSKKVRAVVFGHIHQSFKARKWGALYTGAPSSCVQFVPKTDKMEVDRRLPGFRWFLLYPNGQIQTGVKRLDRFSQVPDYQSAGY